MNQPTPKDVRLQPDSINILWNDGHQSRYDPRDLRYQCGCAACVNETTGKRVITMSDVSSNLEALDWIPVGRYAMQFLWTDAHITGIYPYTTLRALCQCEACKVSSPQ